MLSTLLNKFRVGIDLQCNQGNPIGDDPSLMTFREVETLFHEAGYAHANTKLPLQLTLHHEHYVATIAI